MKFQMQVSVFAIVLPLFLSVARADGASPSEFWSRVGGLIDRCAVQTYTVRNGSRVDGPMRSTCAELVVHGNQASFTVDQQSYLATIVDSPDSDGGDLNDVYVQDQSGKRIAERHDVPAFGDVLLALAGGRAQVAEQYVQDSFGF